MIQCDDDQGDQFDEDQGDQYDDVQCVDDQGDPYDDDLDDQWDVDVESHLEDLSDSLQGQQSGPV